LSGAKRLRRVRPGPAAPHFFYGTLIDRELLARVSGRRVPESDIEPATLRGWRRVGVVGRSYPILVASPGGSVEGVLVRGLGDGAERRLADYEGPNYRLARSTAIDRRGRPVACAVFLFAGGLRPDRREWRLERWQRRWKRRALRRAARLGRSCEAD